MILPLNEEINFPLIYWYPLGPQLSNSVPNCTKHLHVVMNSLKVIFFFKELFICLLSLKKIIKGSQKKIQSARLSDNIKPILHPPFSKKKWMEEVSQFCTPPFSKKKWRKLANFAPPPSPRKNEWRKLKKC